MNALIPLLFLLAAPAPAARPKAVHFKRITEPREGAFTLLAPREWRLTGGITRVDPNASGGALNSISAKLDMGLSSPDGRITLRWYPETMFVDPRRMPAAGMFPPGSNYNGALVLPLPNAFGYIEQGFRYIHPQAGNLQTKGRYPLPKLAQSYAKLTQQLGIPIAFRFDVGVGSNAWNHRWVNANGEAIYSDDPSYDPKKDGLSGFERSAVRKRFPSR